MERVNASVPFLARLVRIVGGIGFLTSLLGVLGAGFIGMWWFGAIAAVSAWYAHSIAQRSTSSLKRPIDRVSVPA